MIGLFVLILLACLAYLLVKLLIGSVIVAVVAACLVLLLGYGPAGSPGGRYFRGPR